MRQDPSREPLGLLLSDDLLLTSRVTTTARGLGLLVKPARSVEALERLARDVGPSCVLVNLNQPGLVVGDLIERLRSACPQMPRVVAYGSHVDAAGLREARAAGCDVVLPNSAFVEQLPESLHDWLASSPETEPEA